MAFRRPLSRAIRSPLSDTRLDVHDLVGEALDDDDLGVASRLEKRERREEEKKQLALKGTSGSTKGMKHLDRVTTFDSPSARVGSLLFLVGCDSARILRSKNRILPFLSGLRDSYICPEGPA